MEKISIIYLLSLLSGCEMCLTGIFVVHFPAFLMLEGLNNSNDYSVSSYENGFLFIFKTFSSLIISKLFLDDQGCFYRIVSIDGKSQM